MKLHEGNALHSLISPAVSVNKYAKLQFLVFFLATSADEHKGLARVHLGKMAIHCAYSEMT